MASTEVHNWFGDIVWTPSAQATPTSVEEIVAIVRDPATYPSPVRGVGSNHSTTACASAPAGTTLFMSAMNKIVSIGADTVTTQPGALLKDVAEELVKHGLQFFVNIELGDLSMGAAATCGTKEAAFPGEHGQVSSYCIGARVVTSTGELLEITEADGPLIQAFRSSYGTFGVTYEVTFRVRPLQPMSVHHKVYSLEKYLAALPEITASAQSLMMFMDPMRNKVAVEFRTYHEIEPGQKYSHWQWKLRNFLWKDIGPGWAYLTRRFVPTKLLRSLSLGALSALTFPVLRLVIRGKNTVAADQQIHYPPVANDCKYTFIIWAYPADRYPDAMRAYFQFCKDYYKETGFRITMPSVGYRTYQDQSSLLSYSYTNDSITIDPVTTPEPGWEEFQKAYSLLGQRFDGVPLLNQTNYLTRDMVVTAFGDRIDALERQRVALDPTGRFLSPYFSELLASPAA